MQFKIEKKVKVNGDFYIILAVLTQNNIEYAFANKLESLDGEPTDEYLILSKDEEKLNIEQDNTKISKLLPLFQMKIKEVLNEILN